MISPISSPITPIPIPTAQKTTGENQGFSNMVGNAIEDLTKTQNKADDLALQAATGDLKDVHEFTIASTEAQLATQLTVAVRNKALEAFNEILRMPV